MNPRLAIAALALGAALPAAAEGPFGKSRSEERQELIQKLRRDLIKVDRSIAVTEDLIAHSRSAPYLPDLFFRLAELYVEKSRYRYHFEAERRAEAAKSPLVVPEVKLLKEKAIAIYERVTREFPDFKDDDRVRFFIAHEQRELGLYDQMIKTHEANIEKHPKSPNALEGLLIIGDYWFDKGDLDKSEKLYLQILDRPPSIAHDLARYKMGWVWINRGKHAEAVKYFEQAAGAPLVEGAEGKALNVKSLALSDLVYSYTEARPAKGAIKYFLDLSDSATVFQTILEKLGNRYYIKQEFDNAAPAYRRLLTLARDSERDPERVQRLYETLKAAKGKVPPRAEDVRSVVRVAARVRTDLRLKSDERAGLLEDLELMARDLSTMMQIEAQKKDDKKLSSEAADAYQAYLSLFQIARYRLPMEKNRAEALFAAERHAEAGRQYEEVAKKLKGPEQEEAIYNAVATYHTALRDPLRLSYFERVDCRGGIKQMGAFYVKNFPQNPRVPQVKFNVARAYYDEGEFKPAGELFTAFALEHPTDKDAVVAANLALDAYHNLKDFKGMETAGKRLLQISALPATLHNDVRNILAKARVEEMSEVVITADDGTGEAGQRLLSFAEERRGTDVAQEALRTAFNGYVDRRVLAKASEVAQKILQQYPRSPNAAYVILTQARIAQELGDFDQAAAHYESMYDRFPGDPKAVEALQTAATMRLMVGDARRAVQALERAAGGKARADLVARLAEARAESGDAAGAQAAAEQALRADPAEGLAAAILGRILLDQGRLADAEQRLTAAARAMPKAAKSDPEALAKVYFLLGECLYRQFKDLGPEALERKVQLLGGVQQAYSGAAQLGGEWAVAGLLRLGQSFAVLADTLTAIAEPPGLNEVQRAQFKKEIETQAAPLREKAEEAFATCIKKAKELEVYTPFALACHTRKEVDGQLPRPAPGGAVDPGRLASFREALIKNPNDTLSVEGMARSMIDASDWRRARLMIGRLVELDENRPWAHAAMGLVLARLGDLEQAKGAYKRALELDAGFDKAVVGLAALKCRSGDVDGGKKDLARVKRMPSGTDVDADLGACAR